MDSQFVQKYLELNVTHLSAKRIYQHKRAIPPTFNTWMAWSNRRE
jgi:hypothetical protein